RHRVHERGSRLGRLSGRRPRREDPRGAGGAHGHEDHSADLHRRHARRRRHGSLRRVAQRHGARAADAGRRLVRHGRRPRPLFAAAEGAAAPQDRLSEEHEMTTDTLPVIDVRDLRNSAPRRAIDAACREWGFFQIVGHGIEEGTIAALRRAMDDFFALPLSAKHAIMRTAENPWGFYDRELTRHTRDWKQIYDYGPPDGGALVPQFPRDLPSFQPAITRFYAACDALALELVGVIAATWGCRQTRSLATSGRTTRASCGSTTT